MRAKLLSVGALLILSVTSAPQALADTTPEERAAADALFKEGRALVKQGNYAEACPKLVASQKLDPTAGTLLALGDCFELNGQTASAWATFNDARTLARANGKEARAAEAERRAGLLEPKLSKLVVKVAPESQAEGLVVKRNGKPLDAALFGAALPVDPGEHAIEASAPHRSTWISKVQVEAKAGITTVRVPVLGKEPSQAGASGTGLAQTSPDSTPAGTSAAPGPRVTGASSALGPAGDSPEQPSGWSSQRTVAIGLGGVGIAGLALGTVFGVMTFGEVREIEEKGLCTADDPPRCDPQDVYDDARAYANVSNVAFGVGGAALIAGVVLLATAPSGRAKKPAGRYITVEPAVGMEAAGFALRGAW